MVLAMVSFPVLLPGCPWSQRLEKLLSSQSSGAGLGGLASSQLLQGAGSSQVLTPCVLGPCPEWPIRMGAGVGRRLLLQEGKRERRET